MTALQSEVRRGAYYDSVVLMQLQRGLLDLPGILDAGVVMATAANCELLGQSGLLEDSRPTAGADDLLLVVKAEDEAAARSALTQVDSLLTRRRSAETQDLRPRSLEAAVKSMPEAGWVLVSVPGRYAAGVAREALRLDRHVFLYSDNVSLGEELELKREAQTKGLLVMGPDCGTAIINGVGLGFANRVRRGPIGLVGASGTGLQAVTSAVHSLGSGISHAFGTGSRDLRAEVGGLTAHQALDVLARDAETKVIVLIAKPSSPDVAANLLAAAQGAGKPVVVNFIGQAQPAQRLGSLHFATSLDEAARLAVDIGDSRLVTGVSNRQSPIANLYLRGLFSGGTLAYEALLALQAVLTPLYTNTPIRESQRLMNSVESKAHTILDLGADEFTVGRLHPMMDNDLRLRRLRQEAADSETGLILLDVVLGEGAHPDPAGELAPAIAEALRSAGDRALQIVAVVVGTEDDPQGLAVQVERLTSAGAKVFRTLTETLDFVASLLRPAAVAPAVPVDLGKITAGGLAAINVGLESFYDSLMGQGAKAVQVDWRPPAGGNEKLAGILAKMKRSSKN